AKQVCRLRIAVRTEHSMQALRGRAHPRGKIFKPYRRVDVVTQYGPANLELAFQQGLEPIAQQLPAERGVVARAAPHRFNEAPCQRHASSCCRKIADMRAASRSMVTSGLPMRNA